MNKATKCQRNVDEKGADSKTIFRKKASMNGHLRNGAFKGTSKCKFEKQLPLVNLRGESGAHEAPYVALLIRVSRARVGESPGAQHTAAPLEAE